MPALPEALVQDTERLAEKVTNLGAAQAMDAVITVLRDHVKRLDRQRRRAALKAVVDEFQATIVEPPSSSQEIQAELYDEHGLPK